MIEKSKEKNYTIMDNRLIIEKSWWQRNWKWIIPTTIILFLASMVMTFNIEGNPTDLLQAYSEDVLYKNAIDKANSNERVIEVIGKIDDLDRLAILEGNSKYSNNNNSIEITFRVNGDKRKGKMDISADKNGTDWEYKKINIRIKNPKEEIKILE